MEPDGGYAPLLFDEFGAGKVSFRVHLSVK